MRVKFFPVPVLTPDEANNEINQFCATHRVTALDKQLIADVECSFSAVCMTYQRQGENQASSARKSKIDCREVLSTDDFAVFAQLRILPKSIAEQQGVPVYALFSSSGWVILVLSWKYNPKDKTTVTQS